MPSAIFISPHLDDVAFSCGGTMRRLADAGWTTVLCTVFTRSVPHPQGFALACQLDKGLTPDVDYMRLRREEDAEAARHLEAHEVRWLDLPEAPHRGYRSAPELFGPFTPDDTIEGELNNVLGRAMVGHDLIVAPQAIGRHVDHRRVHDALLRLGVGGRAVWYRDMPYAIRHPTDPAPAGISGSELAVALDAGSIQAKLDACSAYRSQLDFQFGGEDEMRVALEGFAVAEAGRLKIGGRAEAVVAERAAAACLTSGAAPSTCSSRTW